MMRSAARNALLFVLIGGSMLSSLSTAVSSFIPQQHSSTGMLMNRKKSSFAARDYQTNALLLVRGGSDDNNDNNYNNNNLEASDNSSSQQASSSLTPPPPPTDSDHSYTNDSSSTEREQQQQPTAVEQVLMATNPPPSSNRVSLLGPKAASPGPIRRALPNFPWHAVPNSITYLRCLAIPMFAYVFYRPNAHAWTAILFALASFTDWLDGYLARRWDVSSAFGAFLDPVADKLMVSTCLILLTGRYGLQVAVPTAIILAREIAVSALREWMAQQGQRESVKVGMQGKIKTALTMVSLTLYLAIPEDGSGVLGNMGPVALVLLYLSALITVTSGSVYFRAAAPALMEAK
jgi:CDP-diacylglycerol--glycerol-3-phosphate 3-phosphatidyltransferase